MPYQQQLLQEERAYHNPPLHPSQAMNLITSHRILMSRICQSLSGSFIAFSCVLINPALSIRPLILSKTLVGLPSALAIGAVKFCNPRVGASEGAGRSSLSTQMVSSNCSNHPPGSIVIGALVEPVPLLEGERAEKLTAVDQIEGNLEESPSSHRPLYNELVWLLKLWLKDNIPSNMQFDGAKSSDE